MALPKNMPNTQPDPEGDIAMLTEAIQAEKSKNDVIKALSAHVGKVWVQNQKDFKATRREMVESLQRVRGQYSQEKLSAIRTFKGTETFIRSGENKCRAAESWVKDIYRGDTDIPWALEPTAVPDLPDQSIQDAEVKTQNQIAQIEAQLMESAGMVNPDEVASMLQDYYDELLDKEREDLVKEAKERCKRAEVVIRDQSQEGGWRGAFNDFLFWFTRTKFGCIKGPILTKAKKSVWKSTPTGYALQTVDSLITDVYAVSPFSLWPSKGMTSINDGDLIEVHQLSRQAIADLIGVPGYSDEEITAVLAELDSGKLKKKWFTIDDETVVNKVLHEAKDRVQSTPQTQDTTELNTEHIWAQEFYGSVSGKMLLEWGSQGNIEASKQYQANVWKIGDHVIKAVINPDTLGRKPYHISSWAKNPANIIGEGLIEFAAPVEDAMNAVIRALINNIAIASGPLTEIDKDRVDTRTPLYPWRTIESTNKQMKASGPAVNYYQPQMHAGELIQAWQFFGKVLDEMTVPAYAQGAAQAGVTAGTATVFTQLLAAASRSIKAVVANIDDDIVTPYIQMAYDYNMKFSQDQSIKGDARVVAKGINGLLAREQQAQRKVEFLQVAMTPVLSEILGAKNLGALAAQIAKSQDITLPDMDRLDGSIDMQVQVSELIRASQGIIEDPNQDTGQVANGGGAPTKAKGVNPDGAKAGQNNG
jgi:hypothetical protein